MNPTVYVDATIPSFYFEQRPGTIIQAWREITVAFWEHAQGRYELFVSDETLRELQDLRLPHAETAAMFGPSCWASSLGGHPGSHRLGRLLCPRRSHALKRFRRRFSPGLCHLVSLTISSDMELQASGECQ